MVVIDKQQPKGYILCGLIHGALVGCEELYNKAIGHNQIQVNV